jgi:hypothetical protein
LFAERPSASRVGIALAAFDDPNALPPECHFFVSSKIGWVRLQLKLNVQRPEVLIWENSKTIGSDLSFIN